MLSPAARTLQNGMYSVDRVYGCIMASQCFCSAGFCSNVIAVADQCWGNRLVPQEQSASACTDVAGVHGRACRLYCLQLVPCLSHGCCVHGAGP